MGNNYMAKSKANGLPKPPIQPALNATKTIEETAVEVLTAIRQHTPEQQNRIIAEVLKETAFERHNTLMAIREDANKAQFDYEEFMKVQSAGERALNEQSKPR
jgi:hypothetical protein